MTRFLPFGGGLIALLAVVLASGLFLNQDTSAQATTHFNPCGSTAVTNSAPNVASDITTTFGVALAPDCGPFSNPDIHPSQYNTGGLIYFTPTAWGLTPNIPVGTQIGTFSSKATLGLLNNPCNQVLSVPFKLYAATIDQNGPKVDEKPVGQDDRLSTMADIDKNGIPDAAEKWPTYLNAVATKQGMDLSQLIGRYVGTNPSPGQQFGDVQGTTVVLNFLIFQPGATVSNKVQLDPRLGYPSVTILQDTSSIASAGDPINDFCAPLWTQAILSGSAGGTTIHSNPPDGVYDFVTWTQPAPDADGDGIENALDPCPYTDSSAWDPRGAKVQAGGDSDGDGIPDDCDPFPLVKSIGVAGNGMSGADEDGDRWANMADNCPLIPNPDQADTDGDGIGDACDKNPTVVDGQGPPVCLVSAITIGAGGAQPADPTKMTPCDPTAPIPASNQATNTPGPTPTFIPGTTTRPTVAPAGGAGGTSGTSGTSGVGGAPGSGIGSLAPAGTSIPAWAAMLAALGAVGLCLGFGLMGARIWRRR
jgi:Thrombospondin type 3 repeat